MPPISVKDSRQQLYTDCFCAGSDIRNRATILRAMDLVGLLTLTKDVGFLDHILIFPALSGRFASPRTTTQFNTCIDPITEGDRVPL
jgi:hypothetical protein